MNELLIMGSRKATVGSFYLLLLLAGCAASLISSPSTGSSTGTPAVPARTYHAYGDSITAGVTLTTPTLAYPSLIAQDRQIAFANYGIGGSQACDVPTTQIFANQDSPTGASSLATLMIGTNDEDTRPADYFGVFNLCHQAAIAWLALPASLKVLASATGVVTSGPGQIETANNWNAWMTQAPASSITFPITLAAAGPIYLWPRIVDFDPGAFTYALDGKVLGTFTTNPGVVIRTSNGISDSMGFIRLAAVPAGVHTVTFTQTSASGTMRIVAVGAPSSTASSLPAVVVGDPPLQEVGTSAPCNVSPAVCDAYLTNIVNNAALFAADGLNVKYVDNHPVMHANPSEMNDILHPNPLGQSELRTAFETAIP